MGCMHAPTFHISDLSRAFGLSGIIIQQMKMVDLLLHHEGLRTVPTSLAQDLARIIGNVT